VRTRFEHQRFERDATAMNEGGAGHQCHPEIVLSTTDGKKLRLTQDEAKRYSTVIASIIEGILQAL